MTVLCFVMDAYRKTRHIAYYGNVAIERRKCPDCHRFAFVIEGKMACCDREIDDGLDWPVKRKRMSICPPGRVGPSDRIKLAILTAQEDKCLYCLRTFGRSVWKGTRRVVLKINWDHLEPYVYAQNNSGTNFVAACHLCNKFKGSLMFPDNRGD